LEAENGNDKKGFLSSNFASAAKNSYGKSLLEGKSRFSRSEWLPIGKNWFPWLEFRLVAPKWPKLASGIQNSFLRPKMEAAQNRIFLRGTHNNSFYSTLQIIPNYKLKPRIAKAALNFLLTSLRKAAKII